jgi:hypothetical protein
LLCYYKRNSQCHLLVSPFAVLQSSPYYDAVFITNIV